MPVSSTLFTCLGLNWPTGLSLSDEEASSVHIVELATTNHSLVPRCWSIPMLLPYTALLLSNPIAGLCWATPHLHQCKEKKKSQAYGKVLRAPLAFSSFSFCLSCFLDPFGVRRRKGLDNKSFQQTLSHQHRNLWKITCNKDRLFIFLCAQCGCPRVSRGYL